MVRISTVRVCLLLLSMTLSFPASSYGAERGITSTSDLVARGVELYYQSHFEDAVKVLSEINLEHMDDADRIRGQEYLARSYVKAGDEESAITTFRSILRQNSNWRLTELSAPPDEVAVFEKAMSQSRQASIVMPLAGAGASILLGIVAANENSKGDAKHDEAQAAADAGAPNLDDLNSEADSHYTKATIFGVSAIAVGLVDLYLWKRYLGRGGRLGPVGGPPSDQGSQFRPLMRLGQVGVSYAF